ncbi:hypothetical protein SNE40_011797 [Patella caerulea]|uniref:G-protein coupled receptors family 1 profile domain-containing protein n=1 Tax=Patella caerulea TaxID=87958 RepID=A0AAN8JM63_PATCE
MSNSTVVYWALNGYGVTAFDLFTNLIILVVAVWIIVLNSLVLQSLREHKNKEATEYYIINLSIADCLTGVYLIYNTSYNLTNYQKISECLLRFGFGLCLCICSGMQTVALSLDRCIKIVSPFRYTDICNTRYVVIVTITTWTLSILIGLLPLMGWINPQENENTCGFMKILTIGYFQLLIVALFTPCILIVIIYLRIFKEAHRHAKSIASSGADSTTTSHSLKFTKTVFIVAGSYLLCWSPMGIVVVLHVIGGLDDYTYVERGNLIIYATAPAYINSLLNPVIYALKVPFIRTRFNRIFCRKREEKGRMELMKTVQTNDVGKTQSTNEKVVLEELQ